MVDNKTQQQIGKQSNQIKIKENTTTNQELQLLSEKAGRFYQQGLFADWPLFRCNSGSQCCYLCSTRTSGKGCFSYG